MPFRVSCSRPRSPHLGIDVAESIARAGAAAEGRRNGVDLIAASENRHQRRVRSDERHLLSDKVSQNEAAILLAERLEVRRRSLPSEDPGSGTRRRSPVPSAGAWRPAYSPSRSGTPRRARRPRSTRRHSRRWRRRRHKRSWTLQPGDRRGLSGCCPSDLSQPMVRPRTTRPGSRSVKLENWAPYKKRCNRNVDESSYVSFRMTRQAGAAL